MSVEQIKKELKQHDWHFEWSDDMKSWRSGQSHRDSIIITSLSEKISKEDFFKLIKQSCSDETVVKQWESRYESIISKR